VFWWSSGMLGRLYSRFLTISSIVIVVGTSYLSESGDPIHSESLEKQLGKPVAVVSKLSINELFSSHLIGATTVFLNVWGRLVELVVFIAGAWEMGVKTNWQGTGGCCFNCSCFVSNPWQTVEKGSNHSGQ
jgi:hypothetical protein